LFPHRLALICGLAGARLIHISTDCVFDGVRGGYRETDPPSPVDLYGHSKWLGELTDYPSCLTLRTSIIGHELKGKYGLVEWMLSRQSPVSGYTNAFFSGVPTVELARIIKDYVLPNPVLSGLYHVSAEPISKFELLRLVNDRYQMGNTVVPFDDVHIDRTLISDRFREATGYRPPPWRELVKAMYHDYVESACYHDRPWEV
jgi:dTDP-4-dehydrorhamnose reductase